MTKPITIGSLHFRKKGDAEAFLQNMLNKYYVGDKVNAEDSEILSQALLLHHDAIKKIGSGIKDFSVRSADFNSKCFWINRTDGSTEKFSFRKCLNSPSDIKK